MPSSWERNIKSIKNCILQIKPNNTFTPALFIILTLMGYFSSQSIVMNKAMFNINFTNMNRNEKAKYKGKINIE